MATYRLLFRTVMQPIGLLFMLSGCYACGPKTEVVHKPYIAHEVRGYVDEFLREADDRNLLQPMVDNFTVLTSIDFGDTTNRDAIGMCFIGWDSRYIVLDQSFQGTPITWRTLVWHELFHCLADLDHYEDGVDIMNASLPLITDEDWLPLVDKAFNRYAN